MAFSERSLYFRGVNQHVDFGNVLSKEYNSVFSISYWFLTTGVGIIIGKRVGSPTYRGYLTGLQSGGQIYFWLNSDYGGGGAGIVGLYEVSDDAVNDGEWHHFVATYDGANNATLYLDGAVLPSSTPYDTLGSNTIVNTAELDFGTYNGVTGSILSGWLDDIAYYNVELQPADVTWIYNSGVPRDLQDVSAPSGLEAYWPFESDAYPTITDLQGSNNGSMQSMSASNFHEQAPGYYIAESFYLVDENPTAYVEGGAAVDPGAVWYYKMRGTDQTCPPEQQPAYVYWVVQGEPDYDASELDPAELPCGSDPSTDVIDIQVAVRWSE